MGAFFYNFDEYFFKQKIKKSFDQKSQIYRAK